MKIDFVTVPSGEFLLGSSDNDELAFDDEKPQRTVWLDEYRISLKPITNAQYKEFVEATGHQLPEHWDDGQIPTGKEQHPVVCVNWYDAQAFCAWLSAESGQTIRLPSEAEWEKAARGTDGRIWPWGNSAPTDKLCNFDGYVDTTTTVGAYPASASPYGALDMAGNVWEWTADLHSAAHPARVVRGGSFRNSHRYVRCAFRNRNVPENRDNLLGFRVVAPGS